jgi:hypothetical protein
MTNNTKDKMTKNMKNILSLFPLLLLAAPAFAQDMPLRRCVCNDLS